MSNQAGRTSPRADPETIASFPGIRAVQNPDWPKYNHARVDQSGVAGVGFATMHIPDFTIARIRELRTKELAYDTIAERLRKVSQDCLGGIAGHETSKLEAGHFAHLGQARVQ